MLEEVLDFKDKTSCGEIGFGSTNILIKCRESV